MFFYDTHAHLDYPDYESDFGSMLERARDAGISRIISIGTDLRSSAKAIQLSEKHPEIFAVVGWHPGNALEAPDDIRAELRELSQHPKVVAIGETGLDYYRLPSANPGFSEKDDEVYKAKQLQIFRQQLEVAAEARLNCVIHQREAFADTIREMETYKGRVRGVFHCFVNGVAEMQRVLDLGSLVSFTGIITFKNAQNVRETLDQTPMGKFMLETDSPYLAPIPYRGKRCEPAYVKEIAQTVAQVKKCSLESLSEATSSTAKDFFKKLA